MQYEHITHKLIRSLGTTLTLFPGTFRTFYQSANLEHNKNNLVSTKKNDAGQIERWKSSANVNNWSAWALTVYRSPRKVTRDMYTHWLTSCVILITWKPSARVNSVEKVCFYVGRCRKREIWSRLLRKMSGVMFESLEFFDCTYEFFFLRNFGNLIFLIWLFIEVFLN